MCHSVCLGEQRETQRRRGHREEERIEESVIALVGRGDQSPCRIRQVDVARETELRVHHQCAGASVNSSTVPQYRYVRARFEPELY